MFTVTMLPVVFIVTILFLLFKTIFYSMAEWNMVKISKSLQKLFSVWSDFLSVISSQGQAVKRITWGRRRRGVDGKGTLPPLADPRKSLDLPRKDVPKLEWLYLTPSTCLMAGHKYWAAMTGRGENHTRRQVIKSPHGPAYHLLANNSHVKAGLHWPYPRSYPCTLCVSRDVLCPLAKRYIRSS